jgi:hypothetical protein
MRRPIQLLAILATGSTFATLSFGDIIYVPNMVNTGPVQYFAAEHPSPQEKLLFTLSNMQAYKVVVYSVTEPTLSGDGKPDPLDTVTNLSRTGGSCGAGTILSPAGDDGSTCTYEISFLMSDNRDFHDPDKDYGLWDIQSDVRAHKDGDPNTVDGFTLSNGTGVAGTIFLANVAVLDKGVTNPLPEPASMLLIGSGLLGLGLLRRKRV